MASKGIGSLIAHRDMNTSASASLVGNPLSMRMHLNPDVVRSIVGVVAFLAIWEIGAHSAQLFASPLPWIGRLPAPEAVMAVWGQLLVQKSYWMDLYLSFLRVSSGFLVALLIGVPYGLLLALNRVAYEVGFPTFEVIRPIPPIAWIPASILFWPTQGLSIGFVIFLGAFFTIVLNVIGGTKSIDRRYFKAATSMGASKLNIFRRVVLPSVLPSIVVGAVVGMGISWEVVIAGELITGGGSASGSGSGIGFFIWNSYVAAGQAAEAKIVVGMISIGIMGYVSSELIRFIGRRVTPWLVVR